jgi:hypothetical protein
VTYTEHSKPKAVTALDVICALKRQGRTLHGCHENGDKEEEIDLQHTCEGGKTNSQQCGREKRGRQA